MFDTSLERAIKSRKYAEDLIGPNQRGHFDTQRDVAKDIFNTNWQQIQNNFQNLKDKLESQRIKGNQMFQEGLGDVADQSYNRVNAQSADLVKRGLTASGMENRLTQADTTRKGEDVNKLLSQLGSDVNAQMAALSQGTSKVAQSDRELNAGLGETLGDIGTADLANQMVYNKGAAGIAGGKDARDDNNTLQAAQRAAQAAANASSGKKTKEDEELEQYLKQKTITAILSGVNPETGEPLEWDEKQRENALRIIFDADGAGAVKAFDDNSNLTELNEQAKKDYDKLLKDYEKAYGKADDNIKNMLKIYSQNPSANQFELLNPRYSTGVNNSRGVTYDNNGRPVLAGPQQQKELNDNVNNLLSALGKTENGEIPNILLSLMGYPGMAVDDSEIKAIMDKYQGNIDNNPFKDITGSLPSTKFKQDNFLEMTKELGPVFQDKSNYSNMMALNDLKSAVGEKTWNEIMNAYNNRQNQQNILNSHKSSGAKTMDYADLANILYGLR